MYLSGLQANNTQKFTKKAHFREPHFAQYQLFWHLKNRPLPGPISPLSEEYPEIFWLYPILIDIFECPTGQQYPKKCKKAHFWEPHFAQFQLFWHQKWAVWATQCGRDQNFWRHGGLLIWPHHPIAENLKFRICYPRGGTFLVRRCVNVSGHTIMLLK